MLNVEEMNLMAVFDTSDRATAVRDIRDAFHGTEDMELKEALRKLEHKLRQMSEDEFDAIDFTVYEEDAYGE